MQSDLRVRQCIQEMIGSRSSLRGDGLAERISKKTKLSVSEVVAVFSKMREEGELVCDDWHRNLPLSKVTVSIEPEPISTHDKLWLSAMEAAGLNAVEIDSLLTASEVLSDFSLEDLKCIANGLKKIKADQDSLKGQSRYIVSAAYLLGSSKILDSLPEQAIKKFGIKLEKFTKPPFYVITAGSSNPDKVIFVENPQAMETALNANIPNIAWVATYGYGLSMVGDDYGRQLASIVESSNRSVQQLIRSGTPPSLDALFSNDNIYFWGDLDPEGLKIFRRLKSKLPNLKLSSLYQPLLSCLQNSELHHPYTKSTGKEGQKAWSTDDVEINELLKYCTTRGVDQEVLTVEEISLSLFKPHAPPHVGEMIYRTYIEPFDEISADYIADALDVEHDEFARLLSGELRLTAEMAARLSVVMGSSIELWLNLQRAHDLWLAEQWDGAEKLTKMDLKQYQYKTDNQLEGFISQDEIKVSDLAELERLTKGARKAMASASKSLTKGINRAKEELGQRCHQSADETEYLMASPNNASRLMESIAEVELVEPEEVIVLDAFHYHEVIDRTYIQMSNLDDALSEHPVLLAHPEFKKLCEEAIDKLWQLYQEVGKHNPS